MTKQYKDKLDKLKQLLPDHPAVGKGEAAFALMTEERRAPRSAEWVILNNALAAVDMPSEEPAEEKEPNTEPDTAPAEGAAGAAPEPRIVEAAGSAAGASSAGGGE